MENFIYNIWPLLKKATIDFFAFLGVLLTIFEIITKLFPNLQINRTIIVVFIILIALFSMIKNRRKNTVSFYIKNRDVKVSIVIGDILKQKAVIVVPTNTTFDTTNINDFISFKSLQGQVQDRYFSYDLFQLDKMIENRLYGIPYKVLKDRTYSKNKQYEIGTTIEIDAINQRFYFVADSDVNKNGQTINPSILNITQSLSRLWQYIGENGHVEEDIAIPLLGTGRMGIPNTREEVIREIIYSFVASNNTKKIANELKICIRKEDVKEYGININEIIEYLEYVCKYQYSTKNKTGLGTGIEK